MPESSVIYNSSFRDGACSILMANDDASIRDMCKEILLNVAEACFYYASELGGEWKLI